MSFNKILFTANEELSAPFLKMVKENGLPLLHIPLEHFRFETSPDESRQVKEELDEFMFVIHGNFRNARYFIRWMEDENELKRVQQKVNIAADIPTANYLESKGIPAVMPVENARGIDIVEFLLRISQQGNVLYPTTDQKTEEVPGLLQELEMAVAEFQVCRGVSIGEEQLKKYRKEIDKELPDSVILHNRSSVIRVQTAFPDLNLKSFSLISSGITVSQKLKEIGLEADFQAGGNWFSLGNLLNDQILENR